MAYIGAEPVPGLNREVVDISSVFNGNATAFTLQVNSVNVSPESAKNILINLGGVLQNPDTDYTINASTLTFTTAPASGLSFFGLILGAGINTATVADGAITTAKLASDAVGANQLANTSVTAGSYTTADITVDAQGRITAAASGTIANAEIADGAITNAKVNASAAIDGSKISPTFTSNVTVSNTQPEIFLQDTDNNSDFKIQNANGNFKVLDSTSNNGRFTIASDGTATFTQNLNANSGLDVTGAITSTGNLTITNTEPKIFLTDSNNTSDFSIQNENGNFNIFDETNSASRVRIISTGLVGIGTTSPTGKLSIASGTFQTTTPTSTGDDIVISGNQSLGIQFLTLASGTSNNNIYFGDTDDPDIGMIRYAHADNSLQFRTNASERMRIDSSGRVMIGQTSSVVPFMITATASGFGGMNTVGVFGDATAAAQNVGGGVTFSGKYNSGGSQLGFASIRGIKENGTDGNYDGALTFQTRPNGGNMTERMRVNSNGNLLINTTTEVGGSNPQLQVVDTTDAEIFIGNTHTNANGHCNITFGPSNGVSTAIIRGYAIEDASSSAAQTGALQFFVREDGSFKESFRLTREGSINVAEAGNSNVAKLDVTHSGNNGGAGVPTYVCRFYQATNNTGTDHANIQSRHNAALSGQNGVAIDFKNNGGSTTGSIVQGQSTVGYNTSSDYRLKENIVNITDGITRIKQLSPKRFNFIADTTNTLQDGFIAHEVTPVIPEAVTGVKDATYTTYYDNFDTIPEGKAIGDVKEEAAINPQSLDYAKFTPLLTAALQEAIAKIETLETKVAALEAA